MTHSHIAEISGGVEMETQPFSFQSGIQDVS